MPRHFEQYAGADNIGINEFSGAADGPIDMRFCCQVHERLWLVLDEQILDLPVVANIAAFELVPGIIRDRFQLLEVAGVSEIVEVHHAVITVLHQMTDKRGADEPCPAGNDYCFHTRSL